MRTDGRFSGSRFARALTAAGLFAIPIALAAVPLSALDNAPSVCLLRRFGIPCWGCGMTRALAAAARGKWKRAWKYNPRVVVVAPILAAVWAQSFRAATTGSNRRHPDSSGSVRSSE